MAVRRASAVWTGNLKEGSGRLALGSGAFAGAYSFSSRFEEGSGTNPEELIGAAHAGCFSMALSAELSKAGFEPRRIHTQAQVYLENVDGKPTITRIHLDCEATVPGVERQFFEQKAEAAKQGCPVSRALKAVEITLSARLASA